MLQGVTPPLKKAIYQRKKRESGGENKDKKKSSAKLDCVRAFWGIF